MSWQRLKRRRRIQSLIYAVQAYKLGEVVGRNPRYDLLTSHVIVGKHLLVADQAQRLAEVTREKREAIDAQDWERAASLRDKERKILKEGSDTNVAHLVAKASYDQTFGAVRQRQGYNFS